MHRLLFAMQDQLAPTLRRGDLSACEQAVVGQLTGLPGCPFHVILELEITNSPDNVAAYFDRFFINEGKRFEVQAAYTETNGFSINPDRWFFSPFAFRKYGGLDSFDWLSDWQSEDFPDMTITGLEPLQAVYASDAFRDEAHVDARDVASLLVVIKFQNLILRAAPRMKELRFPLLATAHDYDFIFEVRPGTEVGSRGV
jgi:hypothetical protein